MLEPRAEALRSPGLASPHRHKRNNALPSNATHCAPLGNAVKDFLRSNTGVLINGEI